MGKITAAAGRGGLIQSITPVREPLHPEPPPFKVLSFNLETGRAQSRVTVLDHLMQAKLVFQGQSRRVLSEFMMHLSNVDPDILACSSRSLVDLIRAGEQYGAHSIGVIRRGRPRLGAGRVHVDLSAYSRLGLAGLVERARFTRAPLRISAGWAAGKAVDSR